MPARIEKMPGEPIIVISVDAADFSPESTHTFGQDLMTLLDAQPERVTLINLIPQEIQFSMTELMGTIQLVKDHNPLYCHPNVKGVAAVTTNAGLKLAYEGLRDKAFGGGIFIRVFDTLEGALIFARF